MTDEHDRFLEEWLKERPVAPMSDDLAERILARTANMPQRSPKTLREWCQLLFADFATPKLAYAFASIVIFGFILGLSLPAAHAPAPNKSNSQEMAYFKEVFRSEGTL